jgi:hypothetical protein
MNTVYKILGTSVLHIQREVGLVREVPWWRREGAMGGTAGLSIEGKNNKIIVHQLHYCQVITGIVPIHSVL